MMKRAILLLVLIWLVPWHVHAAKMSAAQIADKIGRATVIVKTKDSGGSVSSGSGFVVDPSGVIVTNLHVVEGADAIQIRFPSGDVYDVTGVRGVDRKRDLAVLQIPGFDLPVVRLGNSNKVKAGDRIVVIGTALGVLENTVTTGVVSGIRQLEGYRIFQMEAAVSRGNSGGPVVNEQGEVIGVTVAKLTGGESLNFAVPINYARGLLQSKVTGGLTKLAASGPSKSLFGEPAQSLPRRWRSTHTGTTKIVRQEGDLLYSETVTPQEFKNAGGKSSILWRKQGDKWVGKTTDHIPCYTSPGTAFQKLKVCEFAWETELTVMSPSRIEGFAIMPPSNAKLKCRKCRFSKGGLEKQGFIWIPE